MHRHFVLNFLFFILILSLPSLSFARFPNNSVMDFRPSIDGSRYLTSEQSQGLYQWGYQLGTTTYYAFEPVEVTLQGTGTTRLAGIVDDLVVTHLTGAFGLTDWLNIGVDYPLVVMKRSLTLSILILQYVILPVAVPNRRVNSSRGI